MSKVNLFYSDEFKNRLRTLAKRYRNIRQDLQPLINQIESGNFMGDQIVGTGYTVLKVRLKNSDIQKGKSGGYRVIYQIQGHQCILMLLIYAKSDQTDISTKQIKDIINGFNND